MKNNLKNPRLLKYVTAKLLMIPVKTGVVSMQK